MAAYCAIGLYQLSIFGAQAFGAVLWGWAGARLGLPTALGLCAALGAAAWHGDVRILQYPLVAGVPGVLDEQRYPVLSVQEGLLALDRGAHQVAPLGPGPVVVPDLVVA